MADAAAAAARERPLQTCPICKKSDPNFRCSKCRQVWYCSRVCQQQHWKARHRRDCRALRAQTELALLLQSSTIDQAHEDYNKSVDYVDELKKQESQVASKDAESSGIDQQQKQTKQQLIAADNEEAAAGERQPNAKPRSVANRTIALVIGKATAQRRCRNSANSFEDIKPKVDFSIQQMPNLCCYQMILRASSDVLLSCIQTRLINQEDHRKILGERHTALLSIRRCGGENDQQEEEEDDLLALRLPGKIHDTRAYYPCSEGGQQSAAAALSVRLSYNPSTVCDDSFLPAADRPYLSISTPASAQTLACRSCNNSVLNITTTTATPVIDRILPLPSGRWDDIFPDYLMCYPGQPMIDIGSEATTAGVQEGCLLEDETMIVLHANHVIAPALAIPGYGEDSHVDLPVTGTKDDGQKEQQEQPLADPTAAARGIRPWRDVVGGATLTCQLCASTLGYAQESSCRIFKHRVRWNGATAGDDDYDEEEDNATRDTFTSLDVSDFVAYEMIRYAETKAIFAFQILQQKANNVGAKTKSLWLRLISWDSRAATSKDYLVDNGVCQLKWHRMVQIMYEVVEQHERHTEDGSPDHLDWMAWTKDWCCLPGKEEKSGENNDDSQQQASSSVVRLWLCSQEWEEVHRALIDGSNFYSSEVKRATIAAKTGQPGIPRDSLGLAALLLST